MKLNFNKDWRFRAEEPNERPFTRHCWKNGESRSYAAEKFNDNAWKPVTLPHDWCYALDFDGDYNLSHGHYKLNLSDSVCNDPMIVPEDKGTPIGWYRKYFTLPEDYKDKRIYIEFEGIFRDSEIYVNGTFIGRHMSGYTGIRFEISDVLYFGEKKNTIAVRVDCTQVEGWFYEGAGIYRNAFLDVRDAVHIEPDSLFLKPVPIFDNGTPVNGRLDISCTLLNDTDHELSANVTFEVEATAVSVSVDVPARASAPLNATLNIASPRLWDIDAPKMYLLKTTVIAGSMHDDCETPFGFRSIRFDPDKGFFLNEKHTPIRGACVHQDFACIGAALPYEYHEYKVRRLREMGCNALRTSHNPPASELLEACDKLGMLVMDETRMFGSSEEALFQMTSTVKRDRNHPSVILWSIGNEEHARQNDDNGKRIALHMIRAIKALDDTHPVTYGGNNAGKFEGINETVDVRGFNYIHIMPNDYLEKYHENHPDQPIVGTEEASSLYHRGEDKLDLDNRKVFGYDECLMPWGSTAEGWLKYCDEHPFISGAFMWTGFDYTGEPTPCHPNSITGFGVIDLCGYAKDVYYYYKSWWRDEDELYLFPHWNHNPGDIVRVAVNSNLEEVELFLNGKSLGRKQMERLGHLEWQVAYEPGKLEAVGFRGGKEVKRFSKMTTGKPAKLTLKLEAAPGRTGSALVTAEVRDENGNIVAPSGTKIIWQVENGELLGLGNGDPKSYEKNQFEKIKIRRRLGGFECFEGGQWLPYNTAGEPSKELFQADSKRIATPGAVTEHFRDPARLVVTAPEHPETSKELRCSFTDGGGDALLEFDRIEGKFKIELNGEVIAESDRTGYPQAFFVKLKNGLNDLKVTLTATGHLEALKKGVFVSRFEEQEQSRFDFHGLCMAAIRKGEGKTTVRVSSDGLAGCEMTI